MEPAMTTPDDTNKVTFDEWAQCPKLAEATRDELAFRIGNLGHMLLVHRRCGYEVSFPKTHPIPWLDVMAAADLHIPDPVSARSAHEQPGHSGA
jgi:hypothetical protein